MHANEREFMKRIQAQSVKIGVIHPPTDAGGYVVFVYSCLSVFVVNLRIVAADVRRQKS